MKFGDKLKQERAKAGLTQEELSLQLGVTCRTLQNYESGTVYPKKRELYTRLAEFFGTDVNYWLTEDLSASAPAVNGGHSKMKGLAMQVSSAFRADDISEEDLDEFMKTLQSAYWEAKDRAKNMPK